VKSLDEFRLLHHPTDEVVSDIILSIADFLLEFAILGHENLADVPNLIHPQVRVRVGISVRVRVSIRVRFPNLIHPQVPIRIGLGLLLGLGLGLGLGLALGFLISSIPRFHI
jgi:hypothetical protein